MSDTMREFIPGQGAMKRERSFSTVFGFGCRKSENPGIRRGAQLTRRQIDIEGISEILWTCASDNRVPEAGRFVVDSL